jgi:uncharacterized membrane protein
MRKMLFLSLLVTVGLSAQAHAKGWNICNKTPEQLTVAIAYKGGGDQWISKGWHVLRSCGGCALVMNHSRTEYVDVYYHAHNGSGEQRIGGTGKFCVSNGEAFTYSNTGRCKTASFRKVQIDTPGDFTTSIVGKANGRVCID